MIWDSSIISCFYQYQEQVSLEFQIIQSLCNKFIGYFVYIVMFTLFLITLYSP